MMQIILIIIATISTLICILFLAMGGKYTSLVENLNSKEYAMKDLYVVGFGLANTKLFALRGNMEKNLKKSMKLEYDNIYYEYYAALAWAQFLTLAMLVVSLGTAFAALIGGDASFMIVGIVLLFVMAIWNITLSKAKESVAKRREACVAEFPNMVSKLSLLINSGMVLREAWFLIANGKEGPLYDLMKKACEYMNNGESDMSAIHKFGVLSDSTEIKKFTSALVQGIEKGNSELADFLLAQTSELWAHKRQLSLQAGEVAAGKLIIPLGITFAGIIMIIVSAAMQSMSF